MQADRRYPVGRGEDRRNKGCLQENKQEREEQRVSSCSAGSRRSCAVHGCLEGVLQGKMELREVIREAARPGAHIPWNGWWQLPSLAGCSVPRCSTAPPAFFQLCSLSRENSDFSRKMAREHTPKWYVHNNSPFTPLELLWATVAGMLKVSHMSLPPGMRQTAS